MTGTTPSIGKLIWLELLSSEEIAEWAKSREQPRKLWRVGDGSQPGVYRFVFPEDKPPSCYIGIAGHLGKRLRDHICPTTKQQSESTIKNSSNCRVRNAIKNWLGKCYLQRLTIEGSVNICGVELNQGSLGDLFARLLLENWAILHSGRIERLSPLNYDVRLAIPQITKDVTHSAKVNLIQTGLRGEIIQRGGRETLLRRDATSGVPQSGK
jgi:hypothetical protein